MTSERAVAADGRDAPGHGHVLGPEGGPCFHGRVDLIQARLDGFGFLDPFLGPAVVVQFGELVMAGAQALLFGLFLVGGNARLGADPAETRGGAPVGLQGRLGPLPARGQFVRRRPKLLHGKPVQEHRIVEPDPAVVLLCEEVPRDGPACRLIGLDTDETGHSRGGGHLVLGQHALHLPGPGPAALALHLFPDRHLAAVVHGDRKGLEGLEVDLLSPVGVEQFRGRLAEPQPLFDQALGDAEARGDGGHGEPGLGEPVERDHLVRGVHGDTDDVLGEREFAGALGGAGHAAGHGVVLIKDPLASEGLQGGEPPAAGDHRIVPDAIFAGTLGPGDQVLEQSVGRDGGLELGQRSRVGGGLAHVLGCEFQLAQWNGPDDRFGMGHEDISLMDGMETSEGPPRFFPGSLRP